MSRNYKFIKELIKLRMSHLMTFRIGFFGPFLVDGSLFIVQLLVFEAIYSNINQIGTWGRGEMIIFIGTFSLINAFNMVIFFFGIIAIPGKIQSGDMDLYLTKPVSPLLRFTFEKVNPGSIPLIIMSICIILYGVRIGHFKISGLQITLYIIFVILMTVLWYDLEVIFRTISFYMIYTRSIMELENIGIDLCMKLPGVVLKGGFKLLFYIILPYGIVSTIPTQILIGSITLTGIGFGLGIVSLFTLFMLVFWKAGLRNYNSASS